MGEFAKIFKQLRTSRDMTQEDMSKALGISRSAISMYEAGKREPDFETLEIIADYFNLDIDYLMGRTDKSTYYIDPETARMAQELLNSPGQRTLLDATRDLAPDNMQILIQMAKALRDGNR